MPHFCPYFALFILEVFGMFWKLLNEGEGDFFPRTSKRRGMTHWRNALQKKRFLTGGK